MLSEDSSEERRVRASAEPVLVLYLNNGISLSHETDNKVELVQRWGAGACVEVETLLGGGRKRRMESEMAALGFSATQIVLGWKIGGVLEGCRTCVEHSIRQGPRHLEGHVYNTETLHNVVCKTRPCTKRLATVISGISLSFLSNIS